jgi:hypothetical protein
MLVQPGFQMGRVSSSLEMHPGEADVFMSKTLAMANLLG